MQMLVDPIESVPCRVRSRAPLAFCVSCEEQPDAVCRSCAARRRRVWHLIEDEEQSVEQVAHRMGLTVGFAADLFAEEQDRRALEGYRQARVANAAVRELYETCCREDPHLTAAELARRAGLSCAVHVRRLLGYVETSATTKNGRHYSSRLLTEISVENAARLVRAMGYVPAELAHGTARQPDGTPCLIRGL